jgi:hypothetical protein
LLWLLRDIDLLSILARAATLSFEALLLGGIAYLFAAYNHHWAGLIVLISGLLALISRHRTMRWARFWPSSFIALAVFILLRADPENWPLGPRPFWQSFSAPDVLQHCNIVSVHSCSRFSRSSNALCRQESCARVGPSTSFLQCVSPVPQCY